MGFKLMILAAEVNFAMEADHAGIDRIFFDLENLHKEERQRGRNTVISHNDIDNIPQIKQVLKKSKLLVRTNPINPNIRDEINKSIDYGADILMLPMVFNHQDVETFINLVNGRCKTCIMIETAQSFSRIDNILNIEGIDEIFVGLNDLHISLGLSFMFEPLSCGLVEYIANKCKGKGIPFGFGGIARIGDGTLPAEKILGEHIRLGSKSVILSRTFKKENDSLTQTEGYLKKEVQKLRKCINELKEWKESQFIDNQKEVMKIVNNIVLNAIN